MIKADFCTTLLLTVILHHPFCYRVVQKCGQHFWPIVPPLGTPKCKVNPKKKKRKLNFEALHHETWPRQKIKKNPPGLGGGGRERERERESMCVCVID